MKMNFDQLENQLKHNVQDLRWSLSKANKTRESALFKQIARIACDVTSLNRQDNVWPYISTSSICLCVQLFDLDGLKDPRLENVLNRFLSVGTDPEEQSTTDYPDSLERDFLFSWTGIRVTVEARFKEDSETCKKVITGFRPAIESQPIYELRCEEE